ncbi:BTAD domain-containing putative transcriptional regulator [Blastococcus litoris]|uniref:BTAD domain-containing putative transcriptional regulator n=1 Tax=Blastococcus litoris TaxID=2171622 RepID=UPI000E303E58|nr:BTAD domain-containing putative transcriptional regulator [Blastococcus litoris]
MLFGLLGAVEARPDAGSPVLDLGSPLQRVLLGLLLTERDRAVSLDRIVAELWGDAPPADPEGSVHTYVSRLRRVLDPDRTGGVLVRTPAGYRLVVPPEGSVDADRFVALAAEARDLVAGGRAAEAVATAERALALWRGPVPLEDAGDRDFAVHARHRLDELRLTCQEDLLAALLALGRPEDVVPEAEDLVRRHPLRERPWVLLVDALSAAGRTADALARYSDAHRLFDDELGVAPGPGLRAAQARAVRAGEDPLPPSRPSTPPLPRPELIGRGREFALLTGLVDGLPRSGPRFALVDGEPGIGKTRLVAEVTAAAGASGAKVAWGRCHEDDDSPALWPWRQILGALSRDAEATLSAPEGGAFAAFERVLRAVVEESADASVVLVVDDLHWADPASLRLLSFLAVELRHGPIAVLVTCRPDSGDVAQVRATLARTAGFELVALGPLDPGSTGRLVERVADGRLDAGVLADLHDRSGGNPFFATELARVVSDGPPGRLPPSVRDVVVRRLDRLPTASRDVLRLAAVAGQRFDVPLLLRAGTDDDVLTDALDAAEAAHLVRPSSGGGLAFAHALVRESLLVETPEVRRSRLHARLAAALTDGGDPFERAHHLVAGRPFTDTRTTVAACARAAERAARDHAHENAARWWERALTTLDDDPAVDAPDLRQELLLRAGATLARAGSWDSATGLLSAAIDAALGRGDAATAAAAAEQFCRLAGLWFPVSYGSYPEDLVQRLEAVLAAAGGDVPAQVRSQAALATVCHYGPDRTRSRRESAAALALARRSGRDDLLVTALVARLSAAWLPGDETAQIEDATELLGLAIGPGRADVAVLALSRRSTARLALGDLAGGDADLAEAWDVARRHELPLLQAQCVSMQAARATLVGSYEVAMELVDRAADLTQRTQLYTQTWTHLVMRAFVWIDQGCLAERVQGLPPESSAGAGAEQFLVALALLQAGQPEAAAAAMAEHDAFRPWPMQWDWLSLTCWQALIAAELADGGVLPSPDVAAAIADRLLPYASHLALQGGIGAMGPVALYLGRAEVAAGRVESAEEHLRAAAATSDRLGLRPSGARAHLALAQLLAERGDAGAADEVAEALRVAEDIGMTGIARDARRLADG